MMALTGYELISFILIGCHVVTCGVRRCGGCNLK
jgi:hypothetical protein